MIARGLLAFVILTGCGVATYRTRPATGQMAVRLVAQDGSEGDELTRWFGDERLSLEAAVLLDASHVEEVQLVNRPDGSRHIVLKFNEAGREQLAAVTGANIDRRLAIVVEGRIAVAPMIRHAIETGEAHITVGPDGDLDAVYNALTGSVE